MFNCPALTDGRRKFVWVKTLATLCSDWGETTRLWTRTCEDSQEPRWSSGMERGGPGSGPNTFRDKTVNIWNVDLKSPHPFYSVLKWSTSCDLEFPTNWNTLLKEPKLFQIKKNLQCELLSWKTAHLWILTLIVVTRPAELKSFRKKKINKIYSNT